VKLKRAQLVVVILAVATAAILYCVYLAWSRNQKIERFRRAYETVRVGDWREAVVAAMGEPQAVTDCPGGPFSDKEKEAEFRSKCFQQFEYVRWMAIYTISFDRNGAVFNKSMVVSP
jgi:hypothetical protein